MPNWNYWYGSISQNAGFKRPTSTSTLTSAWKSNLVRELVTRVGWLGSNSFEPKLTLLACLISFASLFKFFGIVPRRVQNFGNFKVWFHCESKCLSPDDTVEKMHRAGFPQCELPKYLLRCPTWRNDFSHHRLSPRWESMWIFRLLYLLRFPAWLNEFRHSEHLCDFSPLWIREGFKNPSHGYRP